MPLIKVCDFGVAKFQVQAGNWGQMTNQAPESRRKHRGKGTGAWEEGHGHGLMTDVRGGGRSEKAGSSWDILTLEGL